MGRNERAMQRSDYVPSTKYQPYSGIYNWTLNLAERLSLGTITNVLRTLAGRLQVLYVLISNYSI